MKENFRKAFKETGMPKDRLANFLGVSSRTLNRLETGVSSTVNIEMIKKLRSEFGIDLNWLFGEEEVTTDNPVKNMVKEDSTDYNKEEKTVFFDYLKDENEWLKKKNDELLKLLSESFERKNPENMRNSG
jgi:transcriptional regulator with XRE-family HTH domain